MVAITYHTTGVWGAGIEMNLTAAQVDANFDRLSVAVEDLITNPPAPVTPTSISRLGLTYTFHWSDDTEIDVSFPYVSEHWRGEWLPLTFYAALDSVTVAGVGGFAALLDHTSPAEFDPAQTIDAEDVWRQKYSEAPASLLSGLSDVDYTTPPTDGQGLRWVDADSKWKPANIVETLSLNATVALTDGDSGHIRSPAAGSITRLDTALQGGAVTTNDAVVTAKIGAAGAGTAVTNGVITITAAGSAVGDGDTAAPTALNVVAAGDLIYFTVSGTPGGSRTATVSILIAA